MPKFTKKIAQKALDALNFSIDDYDFDISDLVQGMNVEREHLYNPVDERLNIKGRKYILACKIALAHLLEKPDYYDLLKKYVE